MSLLEEELEDLLYENPWLISFDLEPLAHIKGDNERIGRQIRIKGGSKRLDLLFKDHSGRPVVIELKRDELSRHDVGQILEYGGLLKFLEDEEKSKFIKEFGEQLYAYPRLILIGKKYSESVLAAASLSGIELKTWGQEVQEITFPSQDEIIAWKELEHGKFPLHQRHNLADEIWDILEEATEEAIEEGSLINKEGKSYKAALLTSCTIPFCEFLVQYKNENLLATFEYWPEDDDFKFNSKLWWILIYTDLEEDDEELINFFSNKKINDAIYVEDYGFAFPISKSLLAKQNHRKLKKVFIKHIDLALEINKIGSNSASQPIN